MEATIVVLLLLILLCLLPKAFWNGVGYVLMFLALMYLIGGNPHATQSILGSLGTLVFYGLMMGAAVLVGFCLYNIADSIANIVRKRRS
jgi:hypothetical protein